MCSHLTQYLIKKKRVSTSSLGDIKGHRTGATDIKDHSPWLLIWCAPCRIWVFLAFAEPSLATPPHPQACPPLPLFAPLPWVAVCWEGVFAGDFWARSTSLHLPNRLPALPSLAAFKCYLDFVGFCHLVSPKVSWHWWYCWCSVLFSGERWKDSELSEHRVPLGATASDLCVLVPNIPLLC